MPVVVKQTFFRFPIMYFAEMKHQKRISSLSAFCTILSSCLWTFSFAQSYTDASGQLPDNGAKGPSMDVQAVDADHDGDLDIVLANEFQPNTLLMNDGEGTFTKAPASALPQIVHDSEDVAVADYNLDGHPDLIFCSEDDINQGKTDVHEYYLGDGTGNFTTAGYKFPDSEANAVIAAFVNDDAYPDVIFGNKGINAMYLNNGDGTFTHAPERLPSIIRTTQDLAMADIDADGDNDLFAGNENGNVLYLNDGSGFFTDVSTAQLPQGVNMETRKATFGDIDADGDPDLFLSNVMFIQGKDPQNRLYRNDGTGNFTDITETHLPIDLVHTIDAIFEDADADGDKDIIVANVFGARIQVYQNDGAGKFTDATDAILSATYIRDALGVIAADLNGDGARDLYFCDRFMPQQNKKDLLLVNNQISPTSNPSSQTPYIYPNQITDTFFVETKAKDLKVIFLENLQGQLIDTIALQVHKEGVYTGSLGHRKLPAGMYILRLAETKTQSMVMIRG